MGVNTFKFVGMNNVDDPAAIGRPEADRYGRTTTFTEAASIINMDPDNTGGVKTRRGVTATSIVAASHSGWSCGLGAFVVSGGFLNSFDGTTLAPLWPVADAPMTYCQVNNVVVATNDQEYLVIENGVVSQPAPLSDEFMQDPPPGKYPVFYNGRVYYAVGNTLTFTITNSVETCDSRLMRIPIAQEQITGLAAVDDGIYIGTQTKAFFLKGADPVEGFELDEVADFGVVPYTMITTRGDKAAIAKTQGEVMICATQRGIRMGKSGGEFFDPADGAYVTPETNIGAAFLREQDGLVHYVVSLGAGSDYNVYQQPALVVDSLQT